jgi:H+/Cl- antiporter ClcA
VFPFLRRILTYATRWTLIVALLSLATGSAVALFLWSLDEATRLRFEHPWLLYGLPFGGLVVSAVYARWGTKAERGNNIIIETLHSPASSSVPFRMAPFVLVGTLATHLFGGSAGREGTAVQMGGGIAGGMDRWLRLDEDDFGVLLRAGVAAGFAAVFGTPLAGAIFAFEFPGYGRPRFRAIAPALGAAFLADRVTLAWGIEHTQYHISSVAHEGFAHEAGLIARIAIAGVAFGIAGASFARGTRLASRGYARLVRWPVLRPAVAGLLVIGVTLALGTRAYLGLGITSPDSSHTTIVSSFAEGGANNFAWLWKGLLTVLTVGGGFKGGEVTPLFYIGASLGNVMGELLRAPIDLFAGLGFVAVFAGAANAPLTCTVMGAELFGVSHSPFLALACVVSYVVSGRATIYTAQRARRWRTKRRLGFNRHAESERRQE